ncbi:MAG: 3-deoxy-7-phosphoheptulonate synthase [Candidatus Gracilibacteria bacterium]|nr:3-deoxy-7-phosphoheptulonate synthase [Candidatus Gracilibacteria bacterium]MDD4530119.1 3-deoxy-7-phosphoheptulonate synthase [Candidatus Gracilibacteria bacterium]
MGGAIIQQGELISPEQLLSSCPLHILTKRMVLDSRKRLEKIFKGEDDKKVLIIGPCSADFEDSLIEYASFIKGISEEVKDRIEIIMRFYTGKPRSELGWKGLVNSAPGEDPDINKGILQSRQLAIKILELGVPIADEILNPNLTLHFQDLLSYAAIGARSSANQNHREVASGLEFPIGIKNPTSGKVMPMTQSIKSAQGSHEYFILNRILKSSGNDVAHGILRGGESGPNFSIKNIQEYIDLSASKKLKNPGLIIDCNHDNSGKNPDNQILIMQEVLNNIVPSLSTPSVIKGFMVESYIFDGNQKEESGKSIQRGLSLTDPCIGKEKTMQFIYSLYDIIGKSK